MAPPFLKSTLEGGECTASIAGHSTPEEKSRRYILDRIMGWPQSRSGPCGEENIS
jgi:hypothetical protein